MDTKSRDYWRAISTIIVWVMVVGAFALTSVFLAPNMGDSVTGVVFALLAAAVLSSGFIWDWGRGNMSAHRGRHSRKEAEAELYDMASSAGEKRKHDRLSAALSQLSDGELMNLRERLQRGEIDEEDLNYVLRGEE